MEPIVLLRQRLPKSARELIAKLSRFKSVFMLSSLVYCSIHWLVIHNFSIYVFSGALVIGTVATMAVAWLSTWFSSSSST